MTQVPASSHGGPAFNGGTLNGTSDPLLELTPSVVAVTALNIAPPVGATAQGTSELVVRTDGGLRIVDVTADGNVNLTIPSGTGQTIDLQATSGSHLSLREADGIVRLILKNGAKLQVMDHNSTAIFEVRDDGKVIATELPTSDPGVSGALYSIAGTLHVSP